MSSTELKSMQKILELLRPLPFSDNSRLIEELALLIAWGHWSYRHFDKVELNEQQPDIKHAYEAMMQRLEVSGAVFERSKLYSVCPVPVMLEIINHLNSLDFGNQTALATGLIELSRKHNSRDGNSPISIALGELMAQLTEADISEVTLYHELSLSALCSLHNPERATLLVNHISPLVVAVTSLLGCHLKPLRSSHTDEIYSSDSAIVTLPMMPSKSTSRGASLDEDTLITVVEGVIHKAAVLIPASLLFHRSAIAFREKVVKENWLEAVVTTPKDEVQFTPISYAMLVIDKNRDHSAPVQFYDHEKVERSDQYRGLADHIKDRNPGSRGALSSNENIRKNKFDLSISRYKLGPASSIIAAAKDTVSLGGVADIIRAQSLKSEEADSENADAFLEAAIKDIDDSGQLCIPEKRITVSPSEQRRADSQRLRKGDILLVIKGSVGRVAYVGDNCGDNWIAGQAFVIIRTKKSFSMEYLYRYLSSDLISRYLDENSTGAAMQMLKSSDVNDIPVPFSEPDVLQNVEDNHRAIQGEYAAIQKHLDTIRELKGTFWSMDQSEG